MRVGVVAGLVLALAACSGANADAEEVGATQDEIRVVGSFTSRGTAYYPANTRMEGGFLDRRGKRLRTLQQFLAGEAEYVSVAMDVNAFRYGQRLRIRELNEKYGREIVFRVVDTGGAFRNRGRSRLDVCVANRQASYDPTINGTLHVDVIDEASGPPEGEGEGTEAPTSRTAPEGQGASCSNDGACNPGNDGSGMIYEGGRCVPGCRSNAQCPGVTRCVSGQCQ